MYPLTLQIILLKYTDSSQKTNDDNTIKVKLTIGTTVKDLIIHNVNVILLIAIIDSFRMRSIRIFLPLIQQTYILIKKQ